MQFKEKYYKLRFFILQNVLQILLSASVRDKVVKTLFQFHYGSIKIADATACKTALVKFQFHYGSIKIVALTPQK